MKFEKSLHLYGKEADLYLKGYLNETTSFGSLSVSQIEKLSVICKEVELISSIGLKLWVEWFRDVVNRNSNLKLHFVEVPRVLVDQMNRVLGFLPAGSIVDSFYGGFYCPRCDTTVYYKFEQGADYPAGAISGFQSVKLPKLICIGCKRERVPDFVPERYFQFLIDSSNRASS